MLLAAVFVVFNAVYSLTLYPRDLSEKSPELVQIRNSATETDIYYFGESSNVTTAPRDSSQKSISGFMQDFFPDLRVTNINKYATHAGIYKAWLRELDRTKVYPKAIVVTLNLRSFDAAWIHSKLETPLQESVVFSQPLPPLANRFLLSLQAYNYKTDAEREHDMLQTWKRERLEFPFSFEHRTVYEWDRHMANGGHLNEDGTWDTPKIELACHYIKGYAFHIKENNPRLKDFDEIYRWCGKRNVRLYLNLMSENLHYADSLVGAELVFLMRQNRDILVERYHKEHCSVVDNLESVPHTSFIDKNWTTEHYDQRGRMIIARNLADTMQKEFAEHYRRAY